MRLRITGSFIGFVLLVGCVSQPTSQGTSSAPYQIKSLSQQSGVQRRPIAKTKHARDRLLTKASPFQHKGILGFRHIRDYSDAELSRGKQNQLSLIVEHDDIKETVAHRLRESGYLVRVGLADQLVVTLPEHGVNALRRHFDVLDNFPGVLIATPRFGMRSPKHTSEALRKLFYTPNDPKYAPSSPYPSGQWGLPAINADDAWNDSNLRSFSSRLAIIDTGFRGTHEDLSIGSGEMYCGDTKSTPHPTVPTYMPSCGTGYGSDTSHGTAVAGVAGANGGNLTGITGAAFYPFLVTYAVSELESPGPPADYGFYADNIRAAGVHAINGSPSARTLCAVLGVTPDDGHLSSLVGYAELQDVVLVTATGNEDTTISWYPALYSTSYSNVISVGGVDTAGNRWQASPKGSNYGTGITISAPAQNILTTTDTANDSYGLSSGTSVAAPFVAGALSTIRSEADEVDTVTLLDAVKASGAATSYGAGGTWRQEVGYGLFDFEATYNWLAKSNRIYEWNPNTANGTPFYNFGYTKSPSMATNGTSGRYFYRDAFQLGSTSGTNLASYKLIKGNTNGDMKLVTQASFNSGYTTMESNVGYIASVSGAGSLSVPLYSYIYYGAGGAIGHRYGTDLDYSSMLGDGYSPEDGDPSDPDFDPIGWVKSGPYVTSP